MIEIAGIPLIHVLGLFTGLTGLIIGVADLRIMLDTDWDVFTSRFYLRDEESMQTVVHVTYILTAALISLTLSHALFIADQYTTVAIVLQALATALLSLLVAITYGLKKSLAQSSDDAAE